MFDESNEIGKTPELVDREKKLGRIHNLKGRLEQFVAGKGIPKEGADLADFEVIAADYKDLSGVSEDDAKTILQAGLDLREAEKKYNEAPEGDGKDRLRRDLERLKVVEPGLKEIERGMIEDKLKQAD